jgi:hypothetical protein
MIATGARPLGVLMIGIVIQVVQASLIEVAAPVGPIPTIGIEVQAV